MAGVDSLLSSFPAPPTFIPASPLPYDRDYNEDEEDERDEFPFHSMGPPRVPLPALPGGANELDALMSICNSPAPSRRTSVASWRFSRLSDTTVFVKSDHMAPLQPRSSISLPDETSPPTPTAPRPPRSASPDVAELLATTPRPLVRRLGSLSLASGASNSSTSSFINQDDDYSSSQSDGEHSDSSIDIVTPLPNLMVKAGLLSPHSKILIPPGALPAPRVRGAPKDARDTQRRRNRHRDGRLLREGVGLTTGLGWSDSEDEDAPSALTHRLSTVDLSRRGSMMSLGNRSRSHSEYSPSPVGTLRSKLELIKDRSPLSRTLSNSSAATFGTGSAVNQRGGTGAELNRQPRVRQRTTSEGASVRSASSMSIVGAYMSDSENTPDPMPALPALPPKQQHQHMASSHSAGSIARPAGLRKTTSAYPLARSFSIDSELGGASTNSAPYGTLRPLSPSSLLGEKPLPQLPLLENPPPRTDSRGAIRQRAKTSAPPSAFGGISASNRPRTSSTSSATSASSIDSVIHASMSASFEPGSAATTPRPRMMQQTSAPLRRPNAATASSIGKSAGSAMPQLKKRPSLLALSQPPPNPSVVAVGSSPLPSPSSTPTPTSASSVATPISVSPLPLDPMTTPTPEQRTFPEGIPRSKPYSARSPSAPRTLRLGTPQSRMAPPRTSLGASLSSSVSAAPTPAPTTALPVPRGRTTSVTRIAGPRTGAGMTYRSSGVSLGRA